MTKTGRLEIFDLTGGTQWSHIEVLGVMETGLVKWFNNAKGWGFIAGRDGSDIFVHYSHIAGDGFRTLREGQQVRYDLRQGPRGQFAENVQVNEELARAAS